MAPDTHTKNQEYPDKRPKVRHLQGRGKGKGGGKGKGKGNGKKGGVAARPGYRIILVCTQLEDTSGCSSSSSSSCFPPFLPAGTLGQGEGNPKWVPQGWQWSIGALPGDHSSSLCAFYPLLLYFYDVTPLHDSPKMELHRDLSFALHVVFRTDTFSLSQSLCCVVR